MKQITKNALPVMPWFGGKRKLAKDIIKIINQVQHICYAEPFVGMGGVFLRRTHKSKCEIINDFSRDVSNFFRVVQRHPDELLKHLELKVSSRDEFYRLKAIPPESLTDVERAARFIYIQRCAFAGKVIGNDFGLTTDGNGRFCTDLTFPMIKRLHKRIAAVQIMDIDWQDFIKRVDREYTLFYLDPPYFGHEDDYGKDMFNREQFVKMAVLLSDIKGKFILSINDTTEIRKWFCNFYIKEVGLTYTAAGGNKPKAAKELIITNFTYQ